MALYYYYYYNKQINANHNSRNIYSLFTTWMNCSILTERFSPYTFLCEIGLYSHESWMTSPLNAHHGMVDITQGGVHDIPCHSIYLCSTPPALGQNQLFSVAFTLNYRSLSRFFLTLFTVSLSLSVYLSVIISFTSAVFETVQSFVGVSAHPAARPPAPPHCPSS